MRTAEPTAEMAAFRDDMIAVLNKHAGHLDASEMLALAAYTVGQMVAMQDSRRFNAALVMDLVSKNIEAGNEQAITDAHKWMGNA